MENKGVINEVKTKLRGEIFKSLQDESEEKPTPNKENAIINELIVEYLEFNNYRNTASLLKTGKQLLQSHKECINIYCITHFYFIERKWTNWSSTA